MTSTPNQPHFQDPAKAREYLESRVWPKGRICPHCGSVSNDHYALKGKTTRPGLYKCTHCHQPFTVTVGTLFESSKVPLNAWFRAVYLFCCSTARVSVNELHRVLGVDYKTVRLMRRRIRRAMADASNDKPLTGS